MFCRDVEYGVMGFTNTGSTRRNKKALMKDWIKNIAII